MSTCSPEPRLAHQPTRAHRFGRLIRAYGLTAIFAATSFAAQASDRHGGTRPAADAATVTLDVVVTGGRGHAVEALTPDDFVVEENGASMEISGFRAVTAGRSDYQGAEPLTVVVYIDESLLLPVDLVRIRDSVAFFVQNRLPRGAQIVLARHSNGLQVVLAPTHSAEEFTRAFDSILPSRGAVNDAGAVREANDRIDLQERLFGQVRNSAADESVACRAGWNLIVAGARVHAAAANDRLDRSLRSFSTLVAGLRDIPGRKVLLFLSGGLQMKPGTDLFTALADLCLDRQLETATLIREYEQVRAVQQLATQANASRTAIYAFDAAGTATEQDGSRAFFHIRSDLNESLELLATETGGRATLNANFPDAALADLSRDLAAFYTVSYEAPARRFAQTNLLEVKLRGQRKKKLLYPRSMPPMRALESELGERLLSTLLFGTGDNPLGIEARAGGAKASGLPVHVRIPATLVADSTGTREAVLRLYLVARDRFNQGTEMRQHLVREGDLHLNDGHLELVVQMDLPPESYTLALGVRDEATKVMSLLQLHAEVPGELAPRPLLPADAVRPVPRRGEAQRSAKSW